MDKGSRLASEGREVGTWTATRWKKEEKNVRNLEALGRKKIKKKKKM